jgi:hypothetical protein
MKWKFVTLNLVTRKKILSSFVQNVTMEQIIYSNCLSITTNITKHTTLQIYVKIIMMKYLRQKANWNVCIAVKASIKWVNYLSMWN